MNKNEVILHGECMIFPADKIPSDAKRIETQNGIFKIADSETTGNHHVVDVMPDTEIFEHDGKTFMNAKSDTQVRCVIEGRHDNVTIPAGTYEFGTQQEYDPYTQNVRPVQD